LETHDVNLFFIDWGKGARTLDYSLARNRVYDVARVLADFMTFLHDEHGLDYKKIACIGFSLGGMNKLGISELFFKIGSLILILTMHPILTIFLF
jgi:predicted esterase